MEFIYNFFLLVSPIKFYIKILFILFLFILNIYLIITHEKEDSSLEKSSRVLQSGFGNKNFKSVLGGLATFGGFLSAIITVKNELKDVQIGRLDQLKEEEREGIRKSIDKDRETHKNILDSIEGKREELLSLHLDKAKLVGHNDRLLTLHNNLKNNVLAYQNKSIDSSAKLSELGILDQLIKQDTTKFSQELDSLFLQIESFHNLSSSLKEEQSNSSKIIENSQEENVIKDSSIFPFKLEFTNILSWFEGLNGLKKIAVSLILGKSVVFSALISIIFIFYGNILIEKYNLESRFPKLAIFIKLRQKFQKYYFNFYCGLIIFVIITEIAFGLVILSL